MKADTVRTYKSIHTWTGIVSGMALFIAFYAGALTVFKEPLARWASPPSTLQAVPLADAQALIARAVPANPALARDFTLHLHDHEDVPGRLSWQVRDGQADDHDETSTRHYVATLQADGSTATHQVQPSPLAGFIDVLHRVVGLPVDSDPNRWLMGVVSALYALALLSGVVVLLPSLVKDFFALRVGRNLKRMWLDAHNVVGIVSLPFHIVMALTAVVFAFHDQIYDVQNPLLHDGKWGSAFARGAAQPVPTPPRDLSTLLTPQQLVAAARAVSPGFEPSSLQYQQLTTPRAVVRVWGKDAAALSPRARGGFVALDPYSGKVQTRDFMPGQQSTPNLWISSFFALHMAAFGGAAVQWLYFLLGLAGAWLFYSGNLLWVETRRKRLARDGSTPAQRRDTRLMAAATVGVSLGCVCGISLMLLGARWLHGRVDDLLAWHQGLYYAGFFGALAWAFARGAARASVHLLWGAAALTLAIPLSSALALAGLGTAPWVHASPATLGVDATALAGALALAWMARATSRRVRHGPADSVWSAQAAPVPASARETADLVAEPARPAA